MVKVFINFFTTNLFFYQFLLILSLLNSALYLGNDINNDIIQNHIKKQSQIDKFMPGLLH